tara:strand:- start:665 stop:2233 length:1569 start_codon:yes stop_codon:yes gene_type:complete
MGYTYDYDALLDADKDAASNFKDMSVLKDSAGFDNVLTGLVENLGITDANDQTALINAAKTANTGIGAMQNIANLTGEETAEMRNDVFGGSDATQGKSWLDSIAAGGDATGVTIEDLYRGMGRTDAEIAEDTAGLGYWKSSDLSIQDIAKSFQASEEYGLKELYSDHFNRDASMDELKYWMEHTGPDTGYDHETHQSVATGTSADTHKAYDATELLKSSLAEQQETDIRSKLSAELGIHSTDTQRTEAGARAFTDAAESEVNMLIDKWNNEGKAAVETYINNKKAMQTAAQAQGDYGQGTANEGQGATGIHRILRQSEMFGENDAGKTLANDARLALTADDYKPQQTIGSEQLISTTTGADTDTHYGDTTKTYGTTTSWDNVWELLNKLPDTTTTRTETIPGAKKIIIDDDDGGTDGGGGDNTTDDGTTITANTTDVDYDPALSSDVQDQSDYGKAKDKFDDTAEGIDTTARADQLLSADYSKAGRSAKGVRLKRSKKFKSGESALGTKQLSRQLQIKSLNI